MPPQPPPVYKEYAEQKSQKMVGSSDKKLTTPDIEGPFYQPNAPIINTEQLVDDPDFYLHGTVKDENGNPLPDVLLDVWCADRQGHYDNANTYRNRGRFPVSRDGDYRIGLPRPGHYKISDTENRCSHIHVKVWSQNKMLLTTQIYFKDDPFNKDDNWYSENRQVTLPDGRFDFVVKKPE